MEKNAIYSASREVRAYAILDHGANVLIEKTEQEKKGSYHTATSALVLTAFTFEAYLNHLGENELNLWDDTERMLVLDKYNVLCENLKICPDFSILPYQTVKDLIKFRNAIAHGRTKIAKIDNKKISSEDNLFDHTPRAWWEEFSTLENAKRAKEDVSKVIKELHSATGQNDDPFRQGVGSGSLHLNPDYQKRTS